MLPVVRFTFKVRGEKRRRAIECDPSREQLARRFLKSIGARKLRRKERSI
jgi:hypothetical protein